MTQRPVLHMNLGAHIEKMVYCTSLHFLRHEQWHTDGTGSEKHHAVLTGPAQVQHVKRSNSKSEQVSGHGPGAPTVWGDAVSPKKDQICGFYVMLLSTLCISCKHQLQNVYFLCKLFKLWVLSSAPCIPVFEAGVDVV